MDDTYTHGHEEPVLRSHRWRTAANSAAYLLPHLSPGMQLLDVGCGPGTLTADLARYVAPGRVVGLDRSSEVIAEARQLDEVVEFAIGDVYRLDFPDHSFDVVHAHQLLQHLSDPVRALTEMRRLTRPGGVVAVRDGDYAAFAWSPEDRRLDRWRQIYRAVCTTNRAEPDAGRHLPAWVRAAGFSDLEVSSSNWTFADTGSRSWWANSWADRCLASSFASQAVEYGLTSADELAEIADGWREWCRADEAVFIALHVEVLAKT
jgi:ubiquinone/menaquinone biosynthesis C-methylase UbiE